MAGTPTWFGPPDRRLFGWLHQPGDGRARGMAVLCPPIGHEEASALPALQALADRLAADGVAALRFAYAGTGDSAGAWDEAGRLDDWVASIDEALLFARRAHGGPVVLVGMRLGALLAAEAVARGGKVEGLVLWDPCESGRDFLRVERTLLATGYGAGQRGDGSVAGPAFTYAAETAGEIGSLALVPPEAGATHTTLVLVRADSRVRARRTAFTDGGADWEEVGGQAELLDVPPDMLTVPEAAVECAGRWIGQRIEGPTGTIRFQPVDSAVVAGTEDGLAVAEHPVRLGPHRLFGMVTAPSEDRQRAGPTVVFLSAGALDHTGPGRLWVELARRLAAEGVRSVRIDIDGIGETFGRPAAARQVPKPPEAIDDVEDAATALRNGGHPEGVPVESARDELILVGLSSGAYHAIEAGLRLRLAGVAAVNPGLTTWVPELAQGTIDARRLAFRPMPDALRALAVKHRRVAQWVWHAVLQLRVGRSARHPVAGVSRRGTPLLLITSREDAQQFEPSPYWRAVWRRLGRRGLLDVEIVPGGDHSLYTPDGRRDAAPILARWLLARVAATGSEPGHPRR
jgi:alpha-beta hydrolase superfamily lysophospholipase